MSICCEVESCNNEAEFWDETDNKICGDHMKQDMDETGNDSSCYKTIDSEEEWRPDSMRRVTTSKSK